MTIDFEHTELSLYPCEVFRQLKKFSHSVQGLWRGVVLVVVDDDDTGAE